jgi:hypothetical protein
LLAIKNRVQSDMTHYAHAEQDSRASARFYSERAWACFEAARQTGEQRYDQAGRDYTEFMTDAVEAAAAQKTEKEKAQALARNPLRWYLRWR